MNRDELMTRILSVIAPDGMAIFEWPKEESPSTAEVRELAGQIADAILGDDQAVATIMEAARELTDDIDRVVKQTPMRGSTLGASLRLQRLLNDQPRLLWEDFTVMVPMNHLDGKRVPICGLCGNSGIVDTRASARRSDGTVCGVHTYCICPNGRNAKKFVDPVGPPLRRSPAAEDLISTLTAFVRMGIVAAEMGALRNAAESLLAEYRRGATPIVIRDPKLRAEERHAWWQRMEATMKAIEEPDTIEEVLRRAAIPVYASGMAYIPWDAESEILITTLEGIVRSGVVPATYEGLTPVLYSILDVTTLRTRPRGLTASGTRTWDRYVEMAEKSTAMEGVAYEALRRAAIPLDD